MMTQQQLVAAIVVVLTVCTSWGGGEKIPTPLMYELGSLEAAEVPVPDPRSASPRTATFIPASSFINAGKQSQAPVENEIGKSPCPRGTRGVACREELAQSALTCTSDTCEQCRQGCSNISSSMWPTCCRDHFHCCRQLASACQQCNNPQLIPFCTTAFKKCF
ncbi:uncharacterized protein LOC121862460 [Homarus americanus]|uniref:Uncharacterized protein n=1 Tax=Homarus americanus TaxID=6706 RepID=A0A8J5N2S2_HOMAM|nr:uncharacterized protein LOC121862460 [Homarus americanus]KAG7172118.1 hypothetical protein Hamer_G001118 [Homarus americanus]